MKYIYSVTMSIGELVFSKLAHKLATAPVDTPIQYLLRRYFLYRNKIVGFDLVLWKEDLVMDVLFGFGYRANSKEKWSVIFVT